MHPRFFLFITYSPTNFCHLLVIFGGLFGPLVFNTSDDRVQHKSISIEQRYIGLSIYMASPVSSS
jgi:hypothetical protein